MVIHGPNCMGLINLTDPLRLYPSTVTDKVVRGTRRDHRAIRLGRDLADEFDRDRLVQGDHHGQRMAGDGT